MPDLRELLTREAEGLDVPAPPTGDVLSRGKGVRRRRRVVAGAAAVAAAAVVGGAAVLGLGGGSDTDLDTAGMPEPMVGPVFTVGTTLYYGDALDTAEIDDKAVKSIFYTSAGVVVRHGDNSASDGGGPQRFSLVQEDGRVTRLDLVTEDTVHATDSDQPYVAYGENVDGTLEVVLYDVAADREAARVDVGPTSEGWFPVSLDGDTIFVMNGYEGAVKVVDWRTGDVSASEVLSSVWEAHGGYLGDHEDDVPVVRDGRTGEVVLRGPAGGGYFEVSPDGRYAGLVDEEAEMDGEQPGYVVYDIATGSSVTIDGMAFDFGWTPDSDLFKVEDDLVTTCDTATGSCTETEVDLPEGVGEIPMGTTCRSVVGKPGSVCDEPSGPQPPEVRLGGRSYES
ncbi:hypothetical protein HNR19_001305 [Nocardioides thalensis]|uniref:Uncharacterized protein n=1 Tax=Nocardioides thalensis TaxID=1914755 RepID=A0A853C0D0_9ACTN|nr:hypothetical protein [Nocardioides thalensis]NYJ00607.1 hypothetical protein [Nocardioides thalensis]